MPATRDGMSVDLTGRRNGNNTRLAPHRTAIEVIDLSTDSEDESIVEEGNLGGSPVRQENESEDPRLSHLKCVICLDSPTDLTATTCGHLFCHECITAALRVTSTAAGNCPVCRRKVTLKTLIPLAILKQAPLGQVLDLPVLVSPIGVPEAEQPTSKSTSTRVSRKKRPADT